MKQNLFLILFIPFFCISQESIGEFKGALNDRLGHQVSLSSNGSIVAISAIRNSSGNVTVYEKTGTNWMQLDSSINIVVNDNQSVISTSLSSNGNILAIGAPHGDGNGTDSGDVRIYEYISNSWTEIGNLVGEKAGDEFGFSVSLSSDGSTIAIGSTNSEGGSDFAGHVSVYQNVSGSWNKLGSNINGAAEGDASGWSVSLSSNGSTVAVGSPYHDGSNRNSGHVRVFDFNGSNWQQKGTDIFSDGLLESVAGTSVSLSSNGSIVAVGAPYYNSNGANSGRVRIYEYTSSTWTPLGLPIDGESANSFLGAKVSLSSDGSTLTIGSPGNPVNGFNSGQVSIYKNTSGTWTKFGNSLNGKASGDLFGSSLSISSDGSTLVIGAPTNADNGPNSGEVRVYGLGTVLSSDTYLVSKFGISPNPANIQTTIKLQDGIELYTVTIYNSLGQFIQTTKEEIIDTSSLSSGLYFLELVTNKGKATKKLIIE
ncbi:T9SS type A sorting domain-containing protein [Flavivirga eckloniae]|uniref:Secretion system C-terminal sorting domain-containing protein n=1 Tax=Flavivirga eckloniae TaxID=1803846 RepID=A0A2K9PQU3_9FLAO|nr:T9SS type A sorting domain-containing protein [Flavivirga eckloniae]AUP79443.1 hypothetical protein C1H87_12285 [Flavivirga eckloniae]